VSSDPASPGTDCDAPIVILGATSGIGACALEAALDRGLSVRGFARSADKLPAREGLEAVAGDARNPEDLARALTGARAVIYALGIKERPAMIWAEETLFSETTEALIEAMGTAGVSRLVAVTGFGAGRRYGAMSPSGELVNVTLPCRVLAEKSRQEELIMKSALDWTIARPVILTNGAASGRIRVLAEPEAWGNGLISRADVGAYVVRAVTEELNIREDVVLKR